MRQVILKSAMLKIFTELPEKIVAAKSKKAANAAFLMEPLHGNPLCCRFGAVFLAELVDATCGIDNLLCACVKRVAFGTNFDMQGWLANHGLGLETVTATACHGDFLVIWVNICFHFLSLRVV
jgi:hypothetical protein